MRVYVRTKGELTAIAEDYAMRGFRCYRTRTMCGCCGGNNRDAILVASVDDGISTVVLMAIRCKCCERGGEHGTV